MAASKGSSLQLVSAAGAMIVDFLRRPWAAGALLVRDALRWHGASLKRRCVALMLDRTAEVEPRDAQLLARIGAAS